MDAQSLSLLDSKSNSGLVNLELRTSVLTGLRAQNHTPTLTLGLINVTYRLCNYL